jgi:hypothetical protein
MTKTTREELRADLRWMLNKVPEVTLYFWVIKVLCTTVGETASDYLSDNVGLGLTKTTFMTGLLLVAALVVQFRARRYVPWIYWLGIVLISIVGTQITDNLSDNLGVSLVITTVAFAIALSVTFAVWYGSERTLSIHTIYALGPGQAVPARGPPRPCPLEVRVRDLRVGRLLLGARAVLPCELRDRVKQLLVRRPGTDHQDHARSVSVAHEDVLRAGGAVEEVPRPQQPLPAVDEQLALPREHEERFLLRLRVVEAVRLARAEDADVDANLIERVVVALEDARRAGPIGRDPGGVAYVDDEPAFGGGREPGARVFEPRLGHGTSLTIGEIGRFRPRCTGQRFPIRCRHMALEPMQLSPTLGSAVDTWATVAVAIGTIGAVAYALFRDLIVTPRRRPRLDLRFDPAGNDRVVVETAAGSEAAHVRLRVGNRAGKDTADDVVVMLTEVRPVSDSEQKADAKPIHLPLTW